METSPRISPQQFADSMKQEFEEFAKQVMDAVNDARMDRGSLVVKNRFAIFVQRCDERLHCDGWRKHQENTCLCGLRRCHGANHHRCRENQTPRQRQSQASSSRQEVQALATAQARIGLVVEGVQGRLLLQRGCHTSACGLHAWQSCRGGESVAGKREARGGGLTVEVRRDAQGNDLLSGVSGAWLADWEWFDGIAM